MVSELTEQPELALFLSFRLDLLAAKRRHVSGLPQPKRQRTGGRVACPRFQVLQECAPRRAAEEVTVTEPKTIYPTHKPELQPLSHASFRR